MIRALTFSLVLAGAAAALEVAHSPTVARTSGLSLSVPAHWSYSADHVGSEDTWEVVTAGTQGSSPNRGTFVSLSSSKRDYPAPSDEKTIELLQRIGRSINFNGTTPNTERDHVDKVKWGGQSWIVREIDASEHRFYGYANRGKMLYFVFARADVTQVATLRKLLASIRIR